ncbi:MAG: choice-of-anchor I family protein [Actinobacteria bacterium]|nr:choice-of-anchor I family protein [Actinomycetota bacterium]
MKHWILTGALLSGAVVVPLGATAVATPATAAACSATPVGAFDFAAVGRYATAFADTPETRGENVVYEKNTMYVMNVGKIDVVDISDPANPAPTGTLLVPGEPTSVAVKNGLVAVSVPATPKTSAGVVVLFRGSTKVGTVTVGANPDMVTFTHDGALLLVANEGEPNSYGLADSVDPEGSVSVIVTQPFRTRGALKGNVVVTPSTIAFTDFNVGGSRHASLPADVRIYGPGATVAQDLEPEYITVAEDNRTAWVTLQENNAVAKLDLRARRVTSIVALGYADHSVAGHGIDASDQNNLAVNIATWPVKGIYSPDGIANYESKGKRYIVTANEGDARDWPGINAAGAEYNRARSVADLTLFPSANVNNDLGRLNVTQFFPATKNDAGKLTSLYSAGSRSFSIRTADGAMVWDSGDVIECITADLVPEFFNASNSNNTKKNRSDDKGPEPEIVVVGEVERYVNGREVERDLAFVGLERIGGVMVFDITDPTAPVFQQYLRTRDFTALPTATDSGPEGMTFIEADDSPSGKAMLLVGNEVSGTVNIFELTN